MKQLLKKTCLILLGGVMGTMAWAQNAGDYKYFNDFELGSADATLTVHGDGTFVDNGDDMGYVFQNGGGAVRTHYLQLPEDVLSHSATSHEMTIGFWVKRNNAVDFWFSPIFTAYGAAPVDGANTWPMFAVESRGLMYLNNTGWCDFTNNDNDKGTNYEGTFWLDDNKWHYFTIILTETTAKVSVDATNVLNSWTVNGTEGHYIKGLFDNGADLKYICLGGNQAWNWVDNDPAYAFDDIMITNKALTDAEIKQIITDKNPKTVVGNIDNTTGWWAAFSDYYTLEENKTLKLEFDNYSAMSANSDNWILLLTNDKARGEEGYAEYAAIRVDNWGWSPTGDKDNTSWYTAWTSNYNWDVFKQAMNGSHVVMTITRGGNVVNAHADIAGSDGNSYFEDVVLPCGEDGTQNIRAFLTTERGHLLINDTKTTVTDTKITGEITESGYSSFSSFFPLDLSSIDGATANAATGIQNRTVQLTEANGKVPAATGLLMKGTAGAKFTILPTSDATTAPADNMLVGMPAGGELQVATTGFNYVFGWTDPADPGFYKVVDLLPVLPAGKAYLATTEDLNPVTSGAPFLGIEVGGETTGIANVNVNANADSSWYDLFGRRVAQPTKGLYIVNGKKVIIK